MRELWRLATWGLASAGALTLAVYVSTTETAQNRMRQSASQVATVEMPKQAAATTQKSAEEVQRLAEQVRVLNSERERLLMRVATLEQSVADITGSIARPGTAAVRTESARSEEHTLNSSHT